MSRRSIRWSDDGGAALVEFLGLTVVVMLPLVYVIVLLSQVQGAAYASQSAAHTAARAIAVAGVHSLQSGQSAGQAATTAEASATDAIQLTVSGFGIEADDIAMQWTCSGECFAPGTDVVVEVHVTVTAPGVPATAITLVPLSTTLSATASSPIDGLLP